MFTKSFFSVALVLIIGFSAFSQEENAAGGDDKFGTNPENCKMNLSLYREFFVQKNLDDAYVPWSEAFRNCPKSSKNLYIHGVNIIINRMNKEKDNALKLKYIDTLMLMYDIRIQHFGEEGKVLGMKALQIKKIFSKDFEKAYTVFKKSVDLEGEASDGAVVNGYMQTSTEMLKAKKITEEEMFLIYEKCSDIIAGHIKKNPADSTLSTLQNNLDVLLIGTGIATCDKIVSIFQPKFDANKENLSLVKGVVKLLDKQNCTDSKLYAAASEKLNELEPSALSAYSLAKYFVKADQYSKAAEYYKKAIDMQEDPADKAKYYYELAIVSGTKLGQKSAAKGYALKALELKKEWGAPYLLIGTLYALSSKECGSSAFEQSTVFWAAVDKFSYAKSIDPSCADEANKLINSYSQYYPKKEDGFFNNVTEGQSVTVGCWINETTKARY